MIKLSEYAKTLGLNYQTCYSMFKRGDLPVKAIQTQTGSIMVEMPKKIECRVVDSSGQKSFFISIDVDLDVYNLAKEDKIEILELVQYLARKIAHKIQYQIDENSVKLL